MGKPPQHHIDALLFDYENRLRLRSFSFVGFCESPIEFALAVAFLHQEMTSDGLIGVAVPVHRATWLQKIGVVGIVYPQKKIGNYRVDFFVEIKQTADDAVLDRAIVIECDGHEWHERTPDQASRDKARDRYFAERGIPVMRFTGREIWKDPVSCAQQVADAVANIVTDWQIECRRRDHVATLCSDEPANG